MKSLFIFLIILFIAYYLIKAVYRLIRIFFRNDDSINNNRYRNKEGNVTIEYHEKQKKRFDKSKGEYTDYEEIK